MSRRGAGGQSSPFSLAELLASIVVRGQNGLMRGSLARLVVGVAVVLGVSIVAAPSASADEPGETDVSYLLVQQALGHLAHDTSHEGVEAALEKVGDALETDDPEGVDVPTLERARAPLEADDVELARQLLQESIAEALHNPPPATGMQSGTTIVRTELPGRSGLTGEDWGFLAAGGIAVLLGGWLTIRFRPPESMRALRTRLADAGADGSAPHGKGGRA